MIIGDSVLVQCGDEIFRPSDKGKLVKLADTWTLRFNTGVTTTLYGNPEFLTYTDYKENWERFNNIDRSTVFGPRHIFLFEKKRWESIVNLPDYTSGFGMFDINNNDFAKFAASFCYRAKVVKSRPNYYAVEKKRMPEVPLFITQIFGALNIDDDEKNFYFRKCWVTELLDAIFDFTNHLSIPDDMIFEAPDDWWEAYFMGLRESVYCDNSSKVYEMPLSLSDYISELSVVASRIGQPFSVRLKDSSFIKVLLDKSYPNIQIDYGYKNSGVQELYDIGKGEFNVSGVIIRDL